MQWEFSATPCGNFVSFYIDFLAICSFFTTEILIDLIVLVIFSQKVKHWRMTGGNQEKTNRREMRMFAQSSLASLGFVYMLVSFQFFTGMTTDLFWKFFHTTIAWQLSHCTQGAVILVLEIRKSSTPRLNGTTRTVITSRITQMP
ncbi:unnamed protein product, partial [Mesorhabditis belari]|uniref:7TM GPCR serpentine receptor class x (Srx) domain-containing protein n=1 Tax=Mesorhabditis belari TaxID=2138241 RepID=A0AAF3J4S7_9BILA